MKWQKTSLSPWARIPTATEHSSAMRKKNFERVMITPIEIENEMFNTLGCLFR